MRRAAPGPGSEWSYRAGEESCGPRSKVLGGLNSVKGHDAGRSDFGVFKLETPTQSYVINVASRRASEGGRNELVERLEFRNPAAKLRYVPRPR